MTEDQPDVEDLTEQELRTELRQTRSQLRLLESELAETNEGMVALTLELEQARERYQTIFEESTDGILLIDLEQDAIFEANPEACDLLGYDRGTLIGLPPADIFPDEDGRSHTFAEAVIHGWIDEFTCRTNEGRKIDIDISASRITLDGKPLLLTSLRDITERKRREQRIQVLSRIFRHNLRNDGNVIQGLSDLLCEELSDSTLEANAQQIQKTIDEILQLSSKVRRVEDVLDRDQIHPKSISDVLATNRQWFEKAYPAATLTTNVPEHDILVGSRLSAAVREVLENAAEHTESDPLIQISIAVNDQHEYVWIDIEDNGPGVPDYELEALRSQGETQLTHGSGIGLWFTHWVVDSLGGEVAIESSGSDGTVVSLMVPQEMPQDEAELLPEGLTSETR